MPYLDEVEDTHNVVSQRYGVCERHLNVAIRNGARIGPVLCTFGLHTHSQVNTNNNDSKNNNTASQANGDYGNFSHNHNNKQEQTNGTKHNT